MLFQKKRAKWFDKEGMAPAAGVAGYIALIAFFMSQAQHWFGKVPEFLAASMMLTLLSVSVLICALIVLSKPYKLFIDKKGKEALSVLVATAQWLMLFFIVLIAIVAVWR